MDKYVYPSLQSQSVIKSVQKGKSQAKSHFSMHFQTALKTNESLNISKHASERIKERGIEINDVQWQKIQEKVKQAKNMGVKESLVLLEDAALIVSAKNNTVITAMDRNEATSQIFTNINGTIVM